MGEHSSGDPRRETTTRKPGDNDGEEASRSAPSPPQSDTIFDQIGGKPAVAAVVDDFYERVLGDGDLQPYFALAIGNPDRLRRLKAHQRAFIEQALGGERNYAGRSLAEAHQPLDIRPQHFAAVVGHLYDSLIAAGVPVTTSGAIVDALAPLADEVVGQ